MGDLVRGANVASLIQIHLSALKIDISILLFYRINMSVVATNMSALAD